MIINIKKIDEIVKVRFIVYVPVIWKVSGALGKGEWETARWKKTLPPNLSLKRCRQNPFDDEDWINVKQQ